MPDRADNSISLTITEYFSLRHVVKPRIIVSIDTDDPALSIFQLPGGGMRNLSTNKVSQM